MIVARPRQPLCSLPSPAVLRHQRAIRSLRSISRLAAARKTGDRRLRKRRRPWAEQFFVRDIRGSEGKFRWTSANPELQFLLKKTERLKFRLVYGVNKLAPGTSRAS